jgi:hypothetical protein
MPRRCQAGCQMTPYVTTIVTQSPSAGQSSGSFPVSTTPKSGLWSSKRRETCFSNAEQDEIEKYQTCDYPSYLLSP